MGNLKDMSTGRMIRISEAWLDPERDRPKLEALLSGESLLPKIEAAHAGLLATQKKDVNTSKELAAISEAQAKRDGRHDRKIRASWFVLTGFAEATDDPEEAAAILAVRDDLLPKGTSITKDRYADEAGTVETTDARISDATRAMLKKLPVPGGKLWGVVEAWFEEGREIGRLEDQREKLESGGTSAGNGATRADALKARNHWIKVVRHVETAVDLDEASDEVAAAILGPIRAVERETARRNAAGKAESAQPGAPAADASAPAPSPAPAPAASASPA